MSQTERRTDKAEKSALSNLIPPKLAAMGNKRLAELVAMQTEQLEKLQEVNRNWIDRMQSQAKLGSEFVAKLTAARSIPEVATAYQEWASRQMEMATEDAKRIFADGQKLAETGGAFVVQRLAVQWPRQGQHVTPSNASRKHPHANREAIPWVS